MIEQRSPEWFKQRQKKITGSNIGAILGCDPFRKPADVMRAMVRDALGAESEFKGNIATEYGAKFEPYAQADFEMETGLNVTETGFHVHNELDWLGASPDGLINDDTVAVLEIKCPYSKRDKNYFKSIDEQPHYYAQTQIEMYCTGRKKCHFYQWSSVGSRIELIELSSTWLSENLPKLKKFYDAFLVELKNPDKHLADLVQNKQAVKLADEYRQLKAQEKEIKTRLDELKKEFITIADSKKTNISGVLVYPIDRKGAIQYGKIPELKNVDLEQYRSESKTSWGVR